MHEVCYYHQSFVALFTVCLCFLSSCSSLVHLPILTSWCNFVYVELFLLS